jgi:hypothetical protein
MEKTRTKRADLERLNREKRKRAGRLALDHALGIDAQRVVAKRLDKAVRAMMNSTTRRRNTVASQKRRRRQNARYKECDKVAAPRKFRRRDENVGSLELVHVQAGRESEIKWHSVVGRVFRIEGLCGSEWMVFIKSGGENVRTRVRHGKCYNSYEQVPAAQTNKPA